MSRRGEQGSCWRLCPADFLIADFRFSIFDFNRQSTIGNRPLGSRSSRAACRFPSPSHGESGVSLLEVLIAVTILGLSFTAIFSGLSAALRTTNTLGGYNRLIEYAEQKLNELALDPSLGPGQVRSGVSDSGLSWRATTQLADERPSSDPERPVAQLIRISLEASWTTRGSTRSFTLQTLKLRVPEPPPAP
jgi:hypothetical protein